MHVDKHFLDSGAFSQRAKSRQYKKKHHNEWDYYKTDEFKDYLNRYAAFVKKYRLAIDFYANLDVIGNEELSYKNQKRLEKKGLRPIPVCHFDPNKNMTYLQRYIDEGHRLIGLGGMVIRGSQLKATEEWLTCCFNIARKYPDLKFHGFGITKYELLVKYPWYSVDSTTWIKRGAFGEILVPRYIDGEFVFCRDNVRGTPKLVQPYIFAVSDEHGRIKSIDKKKITQGGKFAHNALVDIRKSKRSKVLERVGRKQERNILKWLKYIKVDPLKLRNDNAERVRANLRFFYEFALALPNRPWPLIIFFSGGGAEDFIDRSVSVMTSFYASRNKPEKRLLKLYEYRKDQRR